MELDKQRQSTLITATTTSGPRLEANRTHDGFKRLFFTGPWMEQCSIGNKDGITGSHLLMCDLGLKAFHFGCAGLQVRERAHISARTAAKLTTLHASTSGRASLGRHWP